MSQEVAESPAPPDTPAPETPPVEPATQPQAPVPIESPPPAAQPERESFHDPRARLHQLAAELMRSRNRRLLIEFLQLRRAFR